MTVPGPLSGVHIIEFASYVAGPLAGMTLAQLGARVTKIEPIEGGPDRDRMPIAASGASVYWTSLNKAKDVIRVNLSRPEGIDLAVRLITEGSDTEPKVVLTNARMPDDLTYPALAARRPDLIHVRLTGRRDGSPAVDYTVQAATGMAHFGGTGLGEPALNALPAWDVLTAGHIATAVLAALLRRFATGEGSSISIALEDVALATLGNLGHLIEAQLGMPARPALGNHVFGLLAHDFDTADDRKIMLVILTRRHWHDVVQLMRLTDVVTAFATQVSADFDRPEDRYRHREALVALMAEWFRSRTSEVVEAALAKNHLIWGYYRGLHDLVAGPNELLSSHPLFEEIDQEGIGSVRAPGPPMVWEGQYLGPGTAMTRPSTADVLARRLGLTSGELEDLRRRRVIA